MNKFRKVLGMKIHRATVTGADLHYEGSLTVPSDLMDSASLTDYEAVQVWNVTRGTRFETYAIRGESQSGEICANGAAAHLTRPGDLIIIASFVLVHEDELAEHEPRVLFVDDENRIVRIGPEVPGPAVRG